MGSLKEQIITIKPSNDLIKVAFGANLRKALKDNNIWLSADCGGKGNCGKCKVKLFDSEIRLTSTEKSILSHDELENGIRLACQIHVDQNLEIEIVNYEFPELLKKLMYGKEIDYEIENQLKKIYITLETPVLGNQIDDLKNLEKSISLTSEKLSIPLSVLQGLSSFLRKCDFKVTIAITENKILNIEAGDTTLRLFGLAFDLGTTTIVGTLLDLRTGQDIAVVAKTNPQYIHGVDVISRLDFSINEPGGLSKLQNMVIETINKIIEELTQQVEVNFREIYEISIAGNPIMNHIFLGVNPKSLGEAPYIPTYRECPIYSAEELNLSLLSKAQVMVLPNISAYVGGDITGFILAYDLHKRKKITLSIDIGTNGEIVLGSDNGLLCCSAAAGPAFEGGHLSCGMRATEGAIEKIVFHEGDVHFKVINNTEPKGLCGSGLIDAVAEMLKHGLINQNGKLCNADGVQIQWLKERIIEDEKGNSFILVRETFTANNEPIVITQKDIRQLQLAKGAVFAGIKILIKELNLTEQDIDEILIAGAFGTYINKYNAQLIGLIPSIGEDKIDFVGNAASIGAKKFLLSNNARKETIRIINFTRYIELSNRDDFQHEFTDAMLFQALL